MWFRNAQIHRIAPWTPTQEQLLDALLTQHFRDPTSAELQTCGWTAPFEGGDFAHCVNQQILLTYRSEKKLLPGSVVNQVTRAKAAELEEQQGFKPGRKQMKELKEQVTDELLPRAFGIRRDTRVWIDPVNRWLVIDTASPARADEVRQHIEAGKRCTKLAMTWNDRISFVLTDAFVIKRVTPLDIIKDAADPTAEGEAEKFDADFVLMAGELSRLITDLIEAVGGERPDDRPLLG